METNKKKLRYNIKRKSLTGIQGVYYCKGKPKPYRVGIVYQKKTYDLGRSLTLEEAVNARREAEVRFGAVKHEREKVQYLNPGQWQKIIDLTGKIYPHFKVIKYAGLGPSYVKYWVCPCQCGKTFISTSSKIRMWTTVSCGCTPTDEQPKIYSKGGSICYEGTPVNKLQNRKPYKNNKSVIKGVMHDRCGTWYACICVKKVHYRVKCDSKEQVLYQRAMLEKKYQDPIIKEYLEEIKKENGGNEK